jgi:hypothetical protein
MVFKNLYTSLLLGVVSGSALPAEEGLKSAGISLQQEVSEGVRDYAFYANHPMRKILLLIQSLSALECDYNKIIQEFFDTKRAEGKCSQEGILRGEKSLRNTKKIYDLFSEDLFRSISSEEDLLRQIDTIVWMFIDSVSSLKIGRDTFSSVLFSILRHELSIFVDLCVEVSKIVSLQALDDQSQLLLKLAPSLVESLKQGEVTFSREGDFERKVYLYFFDRVHTALLTSKDAAALLALISNEKIFNLERKIFKDLKKLTSQLEDVLYKGAPEVNLALSHCVWFSLRFVAPKEVEALLSQHPSLKEAFDKASEAFRGLEGELADISGLSDLYPKTTPFVSLSEINNKIKHFKKVEKEEKENRKRQIKKQITDTVKSSRQEYVTLQKQEEVEYAKILAHFSEDLQNETLLRAQRIFEDKEREIKEVGAQMEKELARKEKKHKAFLQKAKGKQEERGADLSQSVHLPSSIRAEEPSPTTRRMPLQIAEEGQSLERLIKKWQELFDLLDPKRRNPRFEEIVSAFESVGGKVDRGGGTSHSKIYFNDKLVDVMVFSTDGYGPNAKKNLKGNFLEIIPGWILTKLVV